MPDEAGGKEGGERGGQQDGEEGGGEDANLLLRLPHHVRWRARRKRDGRAAGERRESSGRAAGARRESGESTAGERRVDSGGRGAGSAAGARREHGGEHGGETVKAWRRGVKGYMGTYKQQGRLHEAQYDATRYKTFEVQNLDHGKTD